MNLSLSKFRIPVLNITLTLVVLSVLTIECMSYSGDRISSETQISKSDIKTPVTYEAVFLTNGQVNPAGLTAVRGSVARTLKLSEVFGDVTPIRQDEEKGSLSFKFEVNNVGQANLTAILAGFTFLILPAYAKDEYKMKVTVYNSGEAGKVYKYEQSVTTWMQLFLIPASPFWGIRDAVDEAFDDMVKKFAEDYQKDNS